MLELMQILGFIERYLGAVQTGLQKTVAQIPGLIEQEVETKARNKLHTTADDYIDAFSARVEGHIIVMELDEDNWLACALEKGVGSWDMRNPPNGMGHLRGKNVKISKKGYHYTHIPLSKQAGGKGGPSEKSKKIQEKINAVMKRPEIVSKYGQKSKLYTKLGDKLTPGVFSGGPIIETQQIDTGGDPEISGLYRTRAFANAEQYSHKNMSKKGMPAWNLIMMRTMSDNPDAKPWVHPGLQAVQILPETNLWVSTIIGKLLDKNIQNEFNKIK